MIQIEGIATISKGVFRFDSGLPSDEPAVDPQTLLGHLCVAPNACVDFRMDGRTTNLPPDVAPVSEGDGYKLKRTTRHYLVQLKVPIDETRAETCRRLTELLHAVLNDITVDREEDRWRAA